MDVTVIEEHLESKSGDLAGGEDRTVSGPRFFGVIDGATDKSGHDWGGGQTGGERLAKLIKALLSDPACPEAPGPLVEKINAFIQSAADKAKIDLHVVHNRADAGVALYVPAKHAIYHINDCQFGFVFEGGTFEVHQNGKLIDELTSDLRARVLLFLKRNGLEPFAGTDDMGRAFIRTMLERQQELQNIDRSDRTAWFGMPRGAFAYKTLNGFPTSFEVTPVPDGVCEVVLASDGFKELRPTLRDSLILLKSMQENDPECMGLLKSTKGLLPGNKTYDDTSYLRLRLSTDSNSRVT